MMRLSRYFWLPLVLVALAGCSGGELRKELGLLHQGPDPFAITTNKPIELPAGTDLPPPRPGQVARVALGPLDVARKLLGVPDADAGPAGSESAGSARAGESLLAALGIAETDPGIRELVDREAEEEREESGLPLVHEWLGLAERSVRSANVLDPAEETERLRAAGVVSYPAAGGER